MVNEQLKNGRENVKSLDLEIIFQRLKWMLFNFWKSLLRAVGCWVVCFERRWHYSLSCHSPNVEARPIPFKCGNFLSEIISTFLAIIFVPFWSINNRAIFGSWKKLFEMVLMFNYWINFQFWKSFRWIDEYLDQSNFFFHKN